MPFFPLCLHQTVATMVQECYKYVDVTDNCLLQCLSIKLRLMDTHRSVTAAKVCQQHL